MSYDVSLYTPGKLCHACGHQSDQVTHFDRNYTGNCSQMWDEAGIEIRKYAYRDDEHAAKAKNLIPDLERAVTTMRDDPERFRAMEPENRWGSYGGALAFISSILAACREYPEALVYVSN